MNLRLYIFFGLIILLFALFVFLYWKKRKDINTAENMEKRREARHKQGKMLSLQVGLSKEFSGKETDYTNQVLALLKTANLDTDLVELFYPDDQEQWVLLNIKQQPLFSLKYKGNLKYWLTNRPLEEFQETYPSVLTYLPASQQEDPTKHCRVFLSTPEDLVLFQDYFIAEFHHLASI